MEKINTVILSDDLDLRIEIKNLLDENRFAIEGYSAFGAEAKTKIINLFPDVVLCAVRGTPEERLFNFVQDVLSTIRGTMMILVTDAITAELVNKAAGYGIRRVLPFTDMTEADFSGETAAAFELERQRSLDTNEGKKTRCKVLGFFGGKGGTGKTSVAVNTAVAIAKTGRRVILLDLDLSFGDAAVSLDAEMKNSIVDLVQDRGGITIDNINTFAVDHSSGLRVLCAPVSSEFAEYVKPAHIEKIIDILRPYYEYVILDMAASFGDVTVTACENCTEIYLVYTPDILSLKNSKMCFDILDQLHQKDKLQLVINRNAKGLVRTSDFTRLLGMEISCVIPDDSRTALLSVNKGIPAVMLQPHSPMANAIGHFADRLIARHSGAPLLTAPVRRKGFGGGAFLMKKNEKKDNPRETDRK